MSAFGIACTCAWTELYSAMKADGMNPPEKCGPATRAWIVALVEREFATRAPVEVSEARVLAAERHLIGLIDPARVTYSQLHGAVSDALTAALATQENPK